MPKPSDMFLGIIEFFAVLLPGALVTWMLWRWPWPIKVETNGPFSSIATIAVPFLPSNSIARWVAFGVVSWGVGQVLFATAAPIDWAWDWLRHRKRIKDGSLTDPADKAVVALRFALLGLAFPAATDPQPNWYGARPEALPVILALLFAEPVVYIGFGLGWECVISTLVIILVLLLFYWSKIVGIVVLILLIAGLAGICGISILGLVGWGCAISIMVVIFVLLLSGWLYFWKDIRQAAAANAEKEATRVHGDWARQYLRQVNIAPSPSLSTIKGAAKDTEEAARKLLQMGVLLKITQSIGTQSVPDISKLVDAADKLHTQAALLQHTADSVDVAQEQAAKAASDLKRATDNVDSARKAFVYWLLVAWRKVSPQFPTKMGAEARLEKAQNELSQVETDNQRKKTAVDSAEQSLKQQIESTEDARKNTIAAALPIQAMSKDLALEATVTAVGNTTFAVTGSTLKQSPSRGAISNYDFACSVLRARAPTAFAEVERLQAQSKFFRSLTTGIFFISYLFLLTLEIRQIHHSKTSQTSLISESLDIPWTIILVVWVVSLALSILLYYRMRKKAVDEAYRSAVVAFALGGRIESGAAVKGGAPG
jgi:hypothetical protein